jgi:hypothetical protein
MFDWEELDVNEVLTLINENVPNPSPELRDQLYGLILATENLIVEKNCLEWVGLTDEAIWLEYQQLWPFHPAEEPTLAKDIAKFARAIETKLKEKNT